MKPPHLPRTLKGRILAAVAVGFVAGLSAFFGAEDEDPDEACCPCAAPPDPSPEASSEPAP